MQPSKKIAVLVSGGVDSSILVHQLTKDDQEVWPIYISNGHQWEAAEVISLRQFLRAIRNRRLKPLTKLSIGAEDLYRYHWSFTGKNVPGAKSKDREVYLPGKNILLIAKASVLCALKKIPRLALGTLKSNPFPDAKPNFFKSMSRLCSKGLGHRIAIKTPFLNRTKKEVMLLGRNLPLGLTFSCLAPKKIVIGTPPHPSLSLSKPRLRGKGARIKVRGYRYIHCGQCNKCAERKKAFSVAHMIDRTQYAN